MATFSQEMQLSVTNKPLNAVLGMLGIEISFDNKALSAYNISVSKTFRNPEEALYYLLNNKPFKVEKINHVYIIIPSDKQITDKNVYTELSGHHKQVIFTGTVSDRETGEPLTFATVSLLNANNHSLITGIVNEKGIFKLPVSESPQKIRISFLGYETITDDISPFGTNLGKFLLKTITIPLAETIVTADEVRHKIDRNSYLITSDMCRDAVNTEDLLHKIPGLYFDKVANTLSVNGSKKILLLVDGIQQSQDYIKQLSPGRIQAVEVINGPSGRFVSDDYTAIINLILNKDYRGYEIYSSNFSAISLSGLNRSEPWILNRPVAGMSYTHDKINFYTTYFHSKENQNLPVSKNLTYRGIELLSETPGNTPNDLYKRKSNTITTGINYQITPMQTISFQGDYVSGKTETNLIYTMERTDITNENRRTIKNSTENATSDYTFVGTLFYQGQIGERFRLYTDFSYNYYYNDIKNKYDQNDASNYIAQDMYNEYKNHTLLNIEGKYILSPQMSINLGYSNAWRMYGSESSHGRGFLNYREYRNKAFTYMMLNFSRKFQTKIGAAIEHINSYDRDIKSNYTRILPYIQANLNINTNINVNASYSTNQHYPSLYQLSPMSLIIDTFLTQIGNPELKSAIRHNITFRVSLGDRLTITPAFDYIHDESSELYIEKGYKLYRSFSNINMREYSLQITYDQPIGKYVRFKNIVTYYLGEGLNAEIKKKPDGWLANSEISYYHPVKSFGFEIGYYRNMKKQMLSQGYQMVDKDNWLISVNKSFWDKRLSLVLSYIPPISAGIRRNQLRVLDTSLYKENTCRHLESYNNMFLLKLSFRFGQGYSKFPERNSTIKNEREKKTIEF